MGFVPERSLVLVALDQTASRARVVGSARVDLEPDPVPALGAFARQAVERGCRGVMLLVYDDPSGGHARPHRELVDRVESLLADQGLRLLDALQVREEESVWRWWSYLCTDESCCPAAGLTVARSSAVDAEAVGRGLVALASRRELIAELLPDPAVAEAVAAEIQSWQAARTDTPQWRCTEVASLDQTIRDLAGDVSPHLMARHLVALADVGVRDLLLVQSDRAEMMAAQQYWRRLVRSAPPGWRAPAATLLAVSCLQSGDGARANVALDAALVTEPEYNLARLVAVAMGSGAITPDDLVDALTEAHAEERRRLTRLGSVRS